MHAPPGARTHAHKRTHAHTPPPPPLSPLRMWADTTALSTHPTKHTRTQQHAYEFFLLSLSHKHALTCTPACMLPPTHAHTRTHFTCGCSRGRTRTQVAALDDDTKMLGYYSPAHGMTLHVIDVDPYSLSRGGGLEDVSLVKKYVMSEEDYDKRAGTLREYARKRREVEPGFKFFAKTPGEMAAAAGGGGGAEEKKPDVSAAECAAHASVGARCEVEPGARRGVVMSVGQVASLAPGFWVRVPAA